MSDAGTERTAGDEGDDGIPIFVDFTVPPPRNAGSDEIFRDVRARGNGQRRVGEVVRNSYGQALDLAERCARQAAARFDSLADGLRPDEVELQLAIRVEAGTVALAKATAEAQIQLTFKWSPRARPEPLTTPALTGARDATGPEAGPPAPE